MFFFKYFIRKLGKSGTKLTKKGIIYIKTVFDTIDFVVIIERITSGSPKFQQMGINI